MKKSHITTFLGVCCALVLSGCAIPDFGARSSEWDQGLTITPPPNPVMKSSSDTSASVSKARVNKISSGHLAGVPDSGTKVKYSTSRRKISSGHLAGIPDQPHKASVQEKSPVQSSTEASKNTTDVAAPEDEKVSFENPTPTPETKAQSPPSTNKPVYLFLYNKKTSG